MTICNRNCNLQRRKSVGEKSKKNRLRGPNVPTRPRALKNNEPALHVGTQFFSFLTITRFTMPHAIEVYLLLVPPYVTVDKVEASHEVIYVGGRGC
jgi:hypothetical protein